MENRDSTKLRKRGSNYAGQDSSVREGEREGEGGERRNYLGYGHDLRVPRTGDSCLQGGIDGNNVILFLNVNALLFCFSAFNRPTDFFTAIFFPFAEFSSPRFSTRRRDDCVSKSRL